MSDNSDQLLDEARRHVRRKRIFYMVLGIWVALCLMWFAIDMFDDSSSIWFYWPMLGTGIAVAITGIVLLGFGGLSGADWESADISTTTSAAGTGRALPASALRHHGGMLPKTASQPAAPRKELSASD